LGLLFSVLVLLRPEEIHHFAHSFFCDRLN
jgi:hypothetical protein